MKYKAYLKTYLPLGLIVLTLIFIFSASLKTADQSSVQSELVRSKLSYIFDKIPLDVRKIAHLAEFALLGTECTVFVLLNKKSIKDCVFFGLITAFTDETLQLFSQGRGASITDMHIDLCGYTAAVAVTLGAYTAIKALKTRKGQNDGK